MATLIDLGYSVTVEGDRIRLRYEGEGSPPTQEDVGHFLEDVRANKGEAIRYLRQREAWDRDMAEIMGDLDAGWLPPHGLRLHAGVYVVDPDRFIESIRMAIRQGPQGPRARTGALQEDVDALKRILH